MKNKISMRLTINKSLLSIFLVVAGMVFIQGAQSQTNHPIIVGNNFFDPSFLKIHLGDTITWTNTSGHHNVNGTQETWQDNPESFGNDVGSGWTFQHVFTELGDYDYQCDPHVLSGMFGAIKVVDNNRITLNFSSMTPHVGQDLWLAIIDKESGMEVFRTKQLVEESFSIVDSTLETGTSYTIDFYADFNQNGSYDAPSTDHAWRIELNDFMADTVIEFVHNTDFTDIEWQHKLSVAFAGMNPHLDQKLMLFLYDKTNAVYVDTLVFDPVSSADFELVSYAIVPGNSYNVDFYADFNANGMYDAPPTDHAWRLGLNNVEGDTSLSFTHNTSFTDIFPQDPSQVTLETGTTSFLIFPNPAQNELRISGDLSEDQVFSFRIYNARGQQVEAFQPKAQVGYYSLDISQLEAGMYFLEVRSAKAYETLRFVKSD